MHVIRHSLNPIPGGVPSVAAFCAAMQSSLALLIFGLASLFLLAVAQDKTAVPPMTPLSQPPYPPGDIRYCSALSSNQPVYRMDVLPGGGFDNLRNVDMGQVHYYNYSLCRVSNDGKYLLPDNAFVIPILYSNVETFAEYFDHWDDYKSTTASSINVGGSVPSVISGKFSDEYQSIKSNQYRMASITTRTQIRHKLYTVRLQPDSQLHPTFKARLFEIAANIQSNNTLLANYLAELLVRDYGTHYISSVDAGGVLAQVDHIHHSSKEDNSSSISRLRALASLDFLEKLMLIPIAGLKDENPENDKTSFISNRTHSQIQTYGGPRFDQGLTVADWSRQLPNALVAIDRSGSPLHFVITSQTLPELPPVTVMEVAKAVHKATNRYYEINTRQGCTIPESKNFDFQANVNDNSCSSAETNFTFGGIFQTCEMVNGTYDLCHHTSDPVMQSNPLTGSTSCPTGYTSIKLNSGQVKHVRAEYKCKERKKKCGFLGLKRCKSCHNVEVISLSVANYETFWCASLGNVPPDSRYLFGGYYTSAQNNPFTGTMSCPQHFLPVHFGEDIQICVSSDYELGLSHAISFAGFLSCHTGNPLAAPGADKNDFSKWPKACPRTYTKHLITIDNGCEISLCVIAGSFNKLSPIPPYLPPFRKYNEYHTDVPRYVPALVGVYGHLWYKGEDGEWKRVTESTMNEDVLFENTSNTTLFFDQFETASLPNNSKLNNT